MILNLKSQTDLSGFYVVYRGSTNLEKPGIYGIAHLMEHLMTKNVDHLQEDYDREGIDFNAYTSNNEIVFHLTGIDEKINERKHEFVELLSEFNVTKDQFENERKIVLEEYMDAFNDQTSSHLLNLNRKVFNSYSPIGLKEDLLNLNFMDCLKFFETQYMFPSKIINVSKNNLYNNNLINFNNKKINREVKFGNYNPKLEINNQFKDKSSIIILSPVIQKDFAYVHFINAMLGLGLKSPLYQEIREKRSLAYYVQIHMMRMNRQGIINIVTQTSNKNTDTVIECVKDIIDNPNKYLTKKRFDLVKDFYKIRKKKMRILKHGNVSKWIEPKSFSIFNIIDTVKFSDIQKVYKEQYDFNNFYISNDKTEFQ